MTVSNYDSVRPWAPWQDWQWLGEGLSSPRKNVVMVHLPGGPLLAAGGSLGDFAFGAAVPCATVERWVPSTGRWHTTRPMAQPRVFHTVSALPDGSALAVGGVTSATTAERFDPDTGHWRRAAPPSRPRSGHSATRLGAGNVLVAGGASEPTTEIYSWRRDTWLAGPVLDRPLGEHCALRLPGDVVLLVGDGVSLLHPDLSTAVRARGLPEASWKGAALLPDGRVALWTVRQWVMQVGIWDPASVDFQWLCAQVEVPRFARVTGRQDGTLVVVTSHPSGTGVTWVVDPMSGDVEGLAGPSGIDRGRQFSTTAMPGGGVLAADDESTLYLD